MRSSWATVLSLVNVSGVERGFRLHQDEVDFFVGDRAMLDAARNDDEFAFADERFAIAELHAQRAFDDEEKFIFVVVVMPDEFAFEFDRFDMAVV